jgi:hypothetical protein
VRLGVARAPGYPEKKLESKTPMTASKRMINPNLSVRDMKPASSAQTRVPSAGESFGSYASESSAADVISRAEIFRRTFSGSRDVSNAVFRWLC